MTCASPPPPASAVAQVVIKRQFLDEERAKSGGNARALTGNAWRAPLRPGSRKPQTTHSACAARSLTLSRPPGRPRCRRYSQSALRAVNQALGRVIRHRFDYGAVILADERFLDRNTQAELSKWLRPSITNFEGFGKATQRRAPGLPPPRPHLRRAERESGAVAASLRCGGRPEESVSVTVSRAAWVSSSRLGARRPRSRPRERRRGPPARRPRRALPRPAAAARSLSRRLRRRSR